MVLFYYARMRFATNLMPQLTAAADKSAGTSSTGSPLSRIVNVHAPGREGDLIGTDLGLSTHYSIINFQAHTISMNALFSEELAQRYPLTSIVNSNPGAVRSNLLKRHSYVLGLLEHVVMMVAWLLGWFVPEAESGERHLFASTTDMFASSESQSGKEGTAIGSDGHLGSGAYLIDFKADKTGKDAVLKNLRAKGMREKVWEHTMEVFATIEKPEATSQTG